MGTVHISSRWSSGRRERRTSDSTFEEVNPYLSDDERTLQHALLMHDQPHRKFSIKGGALPLYLCVVFGVLAYFVWKGWLT